MFVATVLERFEMVPDRARDENELWKVPGIRKEPALTRLNPDERISHSCQFEEVLSD
jgi:hypothetical protein